MELKLDFDEMKEKKEQCPPTPQKLGGFCAFRGCSISSMRSEEQHESVQVDLNSNLTCETLSLG